MYDMHHNFKDYSQQFRQEYEKSAMTDTVRSHQVYMTVMFI